MLGYCRSAALATVAETAQVEACMHGTLLIVCHSNYGSTRNQWQAARRPYKMTCWVEIASGKGRA